MGNSTVLGHFRERTAGVSPYVERSEPAPEPCARPKRVKAQRSLRYRRKEGADAAWTVMRMPACANQGGTAESSVPSRERSPGVFCGKLRNRVTE